MTWTKETVIARLNQIEAKGFISIPSGLYRNDDGIPGQILEREFGVQENNLHLADLGTYELKGMRNKKNKPNTLTLFHKKPVAGMTPIEIFNRFGYVKDSNRSGLPMKKLFTTIKGNRENKRGFVLYPLSETEISLYNKNELLSIWDLSEISKKISQVILVLADTKGAVNSREEQFHYIKGYLLSGLKSISAAIAAGAVQLDFCIDQPADMSKGVHDRGPHIRIPIKKLSMLYNNIEEIL